MTANNKALVSSINRKTPVSSARPAGSRRVRISRIDDPETLRARAIFFAHYICGLVSTEDVLPRLCRSAPVNGALSLGLDAVSLAFAAHRCRHDGMLRSANTKYGLAINSVQSALADPKQMLADDTLQAILLLDTFEKIANPAWQTTKLRLAHAAAALKLLRLRPKSELTNATGRCLTARVLSCTFITHGILQEQIDPDVRTWIDDVAAANGNDRTSNWAVIGPSMDALALAVEFANGHFKTNDRMLAKGCELYALGEQAASKVKGLSVRVRRREDETHAVMYDDFFDMYVNHHTARAANKYRVVQIVCLSLIADLYHPQSKVVSPDQMQQYRDDLENHIADILASVPQYILPDLYPGNCSPFSPEQVLRCYALLPILFLAGCATQEEKVRDWISSVYAYIAKEGSMEIASKMTFLKDSKYYYVGTPFWHHYTMAGSYSFVAYGPGLYRL